MRTISEQTIIKVLVNLKCLGYMGKCVKSFTKQERNKIGDELIRRGWCDENLHPTIESMNVVMRNMHLCEK